MLFLILFSILFPALLPEFTNPLVPPACHGITVVNFMNCFPRQNVEYLLKPLNFHPVQCKTIIDKFAAVGILQVSENLKLSFEFSFFWNLLVICFLTWYLRERSCSRWDISINILGTSSLIHSIPPKLFILSFLTWF